MLRRIVTLAGLALLLIGICISVAQASVPKVIVCEDFGATW